MARWALVLAVAGVLLGFAGFRWHVSREIRGHYAELRRAGAPTSLAEATREFEELRFGTNSAGDYVNALDRMRQGELLPSASRLLGRSNELEVPRIPEGKRREWEGLAEVNRGAMEALAAAGSGPAAHVLRWEDGLRMSLREEGKTGLLLRLVCLEGALALEGTNKAGVMGAIKMSLKAGESLRREPTILGGLTRLRGRQPACRLAELLLSNAALTEGELSELAGMFELEETFGQLRAALGVVRAATEAAFSRPL